jgi:hypothetical protein
MNDLRMLEDMLNSSTREGRDGIVAFARSLQGITLDERTLPIYLKFIRTNVSEAIDELYADREPASFFSRLAPDRRLVTSVLALLSEHTPKTADRRVVLSCLGVLLTAYRSAGEGMALYPMSVQDLFHTAKYFVVEDSEIDMLLEEFLDSLSALPGIQYGPLQLTAVKIRDVHFDASKKLTDIIPGTILV